MFHPETESKLSFLHRLNMKGNVTHTHSHTLELVTPTKKLVKVIYTSMWVGRYACTLHFFLSPILMVNGLLSTYYLNKTL